MERNLHKGRFIVFEGPDGSGQTTQAALLAVALRQEGVEVLVTKEPTGGVVGALIRAILQRKEVVSPRTLQRLFVADRQEHLLAEIIPALERGVTVISDRYFFSTVAFGSLDVPRSDLLRWNSDFLLPDLVVILDVAPEVCVERMKKSRTELELFEELGKLKRVRQVYRRLAEMFEPIVVVVDGERSAAEIAVEILGIVRERFGDGLGA